MLVERTMSSPVGELTLLASRLGLRALLWPGPWIDKVPHTRADDDRTDPAGDERAQQIVADAIVELEEYFAGDRHEFSIALDPVGTPFQLAAWDELRRIPYGETISYGEQARRLGDVKKSRAVGAANGRNPISIIVPCHRVVAANGKLTGFGGGLPTKAWLLDHEILHRAG